MFIWMWIKRRHAAKVAKLAKARQAAPQATGSSASPAP
jgi:hypothetical protein